LDKWYSVDGEGVHPALEEANPLASEAAAVHV
jgi:hypothetical protein